MDYQEVKKNPNANEIDSVNLDTNEMSWGTPPRDPREIGGRIISSPEASAGESANAAPELGQIVPSMPPGYTEPEPAAPNPIVGAAAPTVETSPLQRIHATPGGKFTAEDRAAIQDGERALDASGDIDGFADAFMAARDRFQGKEAA